MMNRLLVFVSTLSLFALGCNIPSFRAEHDFDILIDLEQQKEFEVETFNGSIQIAAADDTKVEIHAHATSSAFTQQEADELAESLEPVVESNEERIRVTSTFPSTLSRIGGGVAYTIKVPKGMKLKAKTSNGAIECADREANVQLVTSNGKIDCQSVSGNMIVKTSNGSIHIRDSLGSATLESSNGRIELAGVKLNGESRMKTSNGSIELGVLDAGPIVFTAKTSNGSVKCDIPNAVVEQTKKSRMSGQLFFAEDNSNVSEKDPIKVDIGMSNGNIRLK